MKWNWTLSRFLVYFNTSSNIVWELAILESHSVHITIMGCNPMMEIWFLNPLPRHCCISWDTVPLLVLVPHPITPFFFIVTTSHDGNLVPQPVPTPSRHKWGFGPRGIFFPGWIIVGDTSGSFFERRRIAITAVLVWQKTVLSEIYANDPPMILLRVLAKWAWHWTPLMCQKTSNQENTCGGEFQYWPAPEIWTTGVMIIQAARGPKRIKLPFSHHTGTAILGCSSKPSI